LKRSWINIRQQGRRRPCTRARRVLRRRRR
jgi:hypothetical protein